MGSNVTIGFDLGHDLDLEFSRSNIEFAISQPKIWPIATKQKANISIELQGLKCDHRVWPWPWPWPWIFKVKYGISYISAKSGPIAMKRIVNLSIELQASNVTNVIFTITLAFGFWRSNVTLTFDHTHDLDQGFSGFWPWIFMVKFWNSRIPEWEGRLTLHKGGGSRSFMTMTMTIWWPRTKCMDLPDSYQRAVDSSSFLNTLG